METLAPQPSGRELRRRRELERAQPLAPREPGDTGRVSRVPAEVRQALVHLPRALAAWVAIEARVGADGGAADVAQREIIRSSGWAPSTYWHARRLLILLGMVAVGPPQRGPKWGPGARRRLTLVHFIPRNVRRAEARSAAKAAKTGGAPPPTARAPEARSAAKAAKTGGAPPPTARAPEAPDRRDAPPANGPPEVLPDVTDGRSALAYLRRGTHRPT